MEAAILGLVGLGGMYTIANQAKRSDRKIKMNSIMTSSGIDTSLVDTKHHTKQYNSAKQDTQKYHTQEAFKKEVQFNIPEPPKQDFTHNNMVPFFGGKIRGAGPDSNQSEFILDNLVGTGSQNISKKEQAPLFRPEDNVQWAHGTPNNSDFYQSRVNPSMAMNNTKPWAEEQVGPGLGKGFSAEGSGGFNSGMEDRNSWLPKNVNELRTLTNPKVTYGLQGHEGPADSLIKDRGSLGIVDKNRPDTYYTNSPERYLTTTGLEKAPTARGIEKLKHQTRVDTSVEYGGVAGRSDKLAGKAPTNFREPKNAHIYGEVRGSAHAGAGLQPTSDSDYGRPGHKVLPNNRTTIKQTEQYGAIGGIIGAVIAPIMDVLRPSRKENVVGNIRLSGNVQRSGAGGEYVYDPNIAAKTTLKQMTENSPFHYNVEKSGAGGEYVHDSNDIAKMTMKQTTEHSPFHLNVQNQESGAYQNTEQQAIFNQRDTTNYDDYGAGGDTSGPHLVDNYLQQRNNNNKQQAAASIHGNMNMFNGEICQRNNNNKTQCNTRASMPSGRSNNSIPTVEQHGQLHGTQQYDNNKIGTDRINPDLLNAFKSNPYTQSLTSWA
jgi:hypothetical protein